MKAVLYIRVSTEEQAAEGVSLDAQAERLTAYCTMRGLHVVEIVRDEGVSAFKRLDTRPGGARLLHLLGTGEASHVVALKLDRLFRNAADALSTTEIWSRTGAALHLVDMGGAAMDTTSATGRMMLTMLAGFAEFERALISERTAQALCYKKRQLHAYSPTPYGFARDGDDLTPHDEEQAILAQIQERAQGGMSLAGIARELNAAKVPTKRGGRWHASTVSYMLRNSLHRKKGAA